MSRKMKRQILLWTAVLLICSKPLAVLASEGMESALFGSEIGADTESFTGSEKKSAAENPPAPEKETGTEEPSEPKKEPGAEEPSEPEKEPGIEEPSEPEKEPGAEEPSEPEKEPGIEEPSEPEKEPGVEEPSEPEKEPGTEELSEPEQDPENPSDSDTTSVPEQSPDAEPPLEEEGETEEEEASILGDMLAMPTAANLDKSNGLEFLYNTGLPLVETRYTAGGGEILWKPVVEGSQIVSGTLILKNATMSGRIAMSVPLRIELEGSNRITESSGRIGIYLMSADGAPLDLTITGSGSLELEGNGSGIQTGGTVNINGTTLKITYGSQSTSTNGIYTIQGDVVIENSHVTVKNNPGISASTGAIYASQSGAGGVRIENSHVIAVNECGAAIHSLKTMEFVSSDVRAIGNTNTGNASGVLNFQYLRMDGGTLYARNLGNDQEIPLFPVSENRVEAKNNAVIYGVSKSYVLPFQGDCVWYTECTYDEASDEITVGRGYVFGNVTWNDNMRFPEGANIYIGTFSTKDTTLTIPAGITVDIPEASKLYVQNSSNYQTKSCFINQGILNISQKAMFVNGEGATALNQGTLNILSGGEMENYQNSVFTNEGTVNVQSGAAVYNYYVKSMKAGGVIQNQGELNVNAGGVIQNQSHLKNSGTIQAAGSFFTVLLTGYDSAVANTGTINGFVIEMHDNSYVNVANGKTVLRSGQRLTVGANVASGPRSRTLKVAEGGELLIEEGAVVDAKTNVTSETLNQYLDLQDPLIVNGLLLLPENVPEEVQAELLEKISGSGKVSLGDTERYIIAADMGEHVEKQLVEEDGQVKLPKNPIRVGYIFRGWYVRNADTKELEPFELQTPVKRSMELVAKWTGVNQWTEPLTINHWVYGSDAASANAVPKFGTVRYSYSALADGDFTEEIPTKAGTWYVKAIVEETEDYTGLVSKAVMFRIEPKSYEEGGSITVSQVNGPEDVQKLVVKDGDTLLQKGTDYQVTTVQEGSRVTVTIRLEGNYTGTIIRSYTLPANPPENNTGSEKDPDSEKDPGSEKPSNPGNEERPDSSEIPRQIHLSKSAQTEDSAPLCFWLFAFIVSCLATGMLYDRISGCHD